MDQGDVNLRSRILLESVRHQAQKAKIWRPTWTKKPKYNGQATFNSKDDMHQIPFAKSQPADQPIWTARISLQEEFGQAQPWSGSSSGSDPIMDELNEMQGHASPDSDTHFQGKGTQESHHSQDNQRMPLRHSAWPGHDSSSTQEKHSTLPQPETRPITQDQLVNEVKGIYAGLVMVEKKCLEIDQQQTKTTKTLSDEQWQALINMHRTLLYEHHDFFLASQHPAASPALRRLAMKYAMPSRMWQHGIRSFLELLQHHLPNNFDHMLAFIYLARSMVTIMEEILPEADKQWADCRRCLESYSEILANAPFASSNLSDHSSPGHISGGWTAQSSPSSRPFIPMLWSSTLSQFPRYNMPDSVAGQEEDFGDWYFRHYSPPELPYAAEIEESYSKVPFKLTDAVLCVLSGWLEYGQAVATDFNIYCKVFHLLLLSGM